MPLLFVSTDLQSVPATVRRNTNQKKQKLQYHVAFVFYFTQIIKQLLWAIPPLIRTSSF